MLPFSLKHHHAWAKSHRASNIGVVLFKYWLIFSLGLLYVPAINQIRTCFVWRKSSPGSRALSLVGPNMKKNNKTPLYLHLTRACRLTQCLTQMRGSNSGHKPEVSSLHWTSAPAAVKRKLCQQSKSTCGVLCFYGSLFFCFFLNLPWERGLDTAVRLDCYSGRAALWLKRISPITNRREEANQSAVPAWELYVSASECGVWTPRTGGWCWDLGTYKRSLESSHCCSYSER